MEYSFKLSFCLLVLAMGVSCAKPEETVNRRRLAPEADAIAGEKNPNEEPVAVVEYENLELVQAKNMEALSADFLNNIAFISKPATDVVVIFGKDGNSWVYNPGNEAPPAAIAPAVVAPEDSSLYPLPDGEFWTVSSEEIGKRKTSADATAGGAVIIERFGTNVFEGDKAKITVLFAAANDLIFTLDTHIVMLNTQNGKPSFNQFVLSKLPIDLEGPVVAAGRGTDKSYWLASKEDVALLTPSGSGFTWTKVKLPLDGQQDYRHLAMWLDKDKKAAEGDVLLLIGDKLLSRSGAPIAADSVD